MFSCQGGGGLIWLNMDIEQLLQDLWQALLFFDLAIAIMSDLNITLFLDCNFLLLFNNELLNLKHCILSHNK